VNNTEPNKVALRNIRHFEEKNRDYATCLTFRNYPPNTPFYVFFSTNIRTEFFKYAAHSPFFYLQNFVYFIVLHFLVPVIIRILHTGCAKI
jgi:hypothetical protein